MEHYTWLHICKDGTPDLRYKSNPRRYYNVKEKFYLTCLLILKICGCKFEYKVSSFDMCRQLEDSINNKIGENINGIE